MSRPLKRVAVSLFITVDKQLKIWYIKILNFIFNRRNGLSLSEKQDSFIGWKSEDGKLEVVGVAGKTRSGHVVYKVTCTECSKDIELFPDRYFTSLKYVLERGSQPCGCSGRYHYNAEQYLIKARRIVGKAFKITKYDEEFHGNETRVACECTVDGHSWTARINNILNGKGCPACAIRKLTDKNRLDYEAATDVCFKICVEEGYTPLGFLGGYKNNKSRFSYMCPIHGLKAASYVKFVIKGTRCPCCAKYGYCKNKSGSFYVVKWTKENDSFIKFGITNQKVSSRISAQHAKTNYKPNILFIARFNDGSLPPEIENRIKSSGLIMGVISKDLFPDGFTETLKTDDLQCLEDLIIQILTEMR